MNRPYEFSDELKSYLIKQYTEFNISVNKLAIETSISVPTIIRMLRLNGVTVSNKAEDKIKKYGKEKKLEVCNNDSDYYVYFHRTVDQDKIFYVGKGTGNRATNKDNRSKDWNDFVENNDYYVEYLAENLLESDALRIESEKILSLPDLLNKNVYFQIDLTKEECSQYFKYSESSPSKLERIKGVWTGTYFKGDLGNAGYIYHYKRLDSKYWKVKFKLKGVLVHRIIWVLFNGDIPENMVIDHIDGNTLNNSIENLRCISKKLNCLNKKKSKANTSGSTGVFRFKDRKDGYEGYTAMVIYGGRSITKNFYFHKHSEEEAMNLATEWRKARIVELNEQGAGYTDRHGT